jgi:hypothetical protein
MVNHFLGNILKLEIAFSPPSLRVQVPEILLDLLGPWLGQRRLKHLLSLIS